MTTMIGVFDKDQDLNGLLKYATILPLFKSVEEALVSSTARLFVHVTDDDWKNICDNLSEERVALRFTTVNGYLRSPPEGKHRNCFSCLKPTKNDGKLTVEEFSKLVGAFSDINIVRQPCTSIPMEIRGLVSFSTVHRLRALHILLQACMAEWGNTPEHGPQAIKLLGCHPAPSSAFARPNRVGLFYRILADSPWVDKKPEDLKTIYKKLQQELGTSDLNSDPKFVTLVDVVWEADNENATVPWETAKTVFKRLDEELVTSRRNGS